MIASVAMVMCLVVFSVGATPWLSPGYTTSTESPQYLQGQEDENPNGDIPSNLDMADLRSSSRDFGFGWDNSNATESSKAPISECSGLCCQNIHCTTRSKTFNVCKNGFTNNPPEDGYHQVCCGHDLSVAQKKKKYFVETVHKADWLEAHRNCQRDGGSLASIDNIEEMTLIRETISKTGVEGKSFWLGGTDHGTEGLWTWISSGSRLNPEILNWTTKNWINPNNANDDENCMEFWLLSEWGPDAGWNDNHCAVKSQYICEYFE